MACPSSLLVLPLSFSKQSVSFGFYPPLSNTLLYCFALVVSTERRARRAHMQVISNICTTNLQQAVAALTM
ncbi:hypothetical protein QBC45DRAFT_404626 [Copromyces sp. CBS 386.78]|nr:hypothetical protein QBC45DRAFT_404626 [Copromyces sp. CBS 386.78]